MVKDVLTYGRLALTCLSAPQGKLSHVVDNCLARAVVLLAKKQSFDFLESSSWPVRSLEIVAMVQREAGAAASLQLSAAGRP
jgi:hypothetical protein